MGSQCVRTVDLNIGAIQLLVKFLVFPEQPPIRLVLVCPPHFVSDIPTDVPQQLGLVAIVHRALDQEVNSLLDPVVAVTVIVEFHGDVVRQIVSLEFPDRDEVWLQVRDLVQGRAERVEILDLLIMKRLAP